MQSQKQYFKDRLNSLSKTKIPYILLRDDNFFKSKENKSEFDILIPSNKLFQTKRFFKKIPHTRTFPNKIDLTHPFLIRIIKEDFQVDFDFQIGGIAYCGSPILKEEFLFQNTKKENDLIYLNKEAEFLMLLIHGFVFKKKFKYFKKYGKNFLELYANSNKKKIHDQIEEMFGKKLAKQVINNIKKRNLKSLFELQRKLRNKHLIKNPLRVFSIIISKVMRFRNYFNLDKMFYFINPFRWAPLISFIGSDGSGKSTLTKKTKRYLTSFRIKNKIISAGVFSSIKNPFKKKKEKDTYSSRVLSTSKEKSPMELLIRILMQVQTQIKILYYRKKGITIISDRYSYDLVNFYGARGILKVLTKHLFQKPTKCFYVKVSPDNLIKRNNDLNLGAIKKVVSTIEKNKEYFSLIELNNRDFTKSGKELNQHLSDVIKNV